MQAVSEHAVQSTEHQESPVFTTVSIPPVNAYWPGQGGKFRGIVRGADGARDYLLIEHVDELPVGNWESVAQAAAAIEADGHKDFSLPNRAEAALLYANAKDEHQTDDWYWTSEQHAAHPDSAWCQTFSYGGQYLTWKGSSLRARAVRRIVI